MSDHAQDVEKPVEPAAESSPAEQLETGAAQGAATPSDSPPEKETESGAQKRIRELTWKQREAERRATELEARLREIESKKPEPSKSEVSIPVESDFDDVDEYRKALDAYTRTAFREEVARQNASQTQAARETERRTKVASYQDRCAKYAADHPEFMSDLEGAFIPAHDHIVEFMTESERGAEITHYLAKNPDHASRIADLGPVAAARELAKIEHTLESASAKRISNAPPPMSDVDDGPSGDAGRITDGMSVEQFLAARAKAGKYVPRR